MVWHLEQPRIKKRNRAIVRLEKEIKNLKEQKRVNFERIHKTAVERYEKLGQECKGSETLD